MGKKLGPRKGPIGDDHMSQFEKLCSMQCTMNEISWWFSCTRDTLILRIEEHYGLDFSTVFKEKKGMGAISLRRAQWKKAIEGQNTTMLIFLGKQYLGQSDFGTEDDIKAILYKTRIGPDGEILSELKNRTEWEADKNFDVKDLLIEENKQVIKPKKKTAKKKK